MKLGPGLSFSWKRALGVTKAKRRVSKKTGIPLTRGGRRIHGAVQPMGILVSIKIAFVRIAPVLDV